jgi:DNA (cytosine-5)-methyltransferase 1
MGFPKNFIIPVSDNQAYKQFGNAVVPPVIATIGREIVYALNNPYFDNQEKPAAITQLELALNL